MFFLDFVSYATEVITDSDMHQEILGSIHAGIDETLKSQFMGGHLGQNKTREKITKKHYWSKMCSDIADYIRSYD